MLEATGAYSDSVAILALAAVVGVATGALFWSDGLYRELIDAAGLPFLPAERKVSDDRLHADETGPGSAECGAIAVAGAAESDMLPSLALKRKLLKARGGGGLCVWTVPRGVPPAQLRVRDVMASPVEVVLRSAVKPQLREQLAASRHNGFPVVAEDGGVCGLLLREEVEQLCYGESSISAEMMDASPCCVHCSWPLERAHRLFMGMGARHVVVLDEAFRKAVGILTRHDLRRTTNRTGGEAVELLRLRKAPSVSSAEAPSVS